MTVVASRVNEVRHFGEKRDLDRLVAEILDPERTKPIVALTARSGGFSIAIPPEEVVRRSAGRASVCCLGSDSVTWALGDLVANTSDPATRIDVPFHGAAVVWWPLAEDGSRSLSSPLVLDKSGRYGPEYTDEVVRILESGPKSLGAQAPGPSLGHQLAEERQRRKVSDRDARDHRLKAEDLSGKLRDAKKEIKRLKKAHPGDSAGEVAGNSASFRTEVASFWAENLMQPGRILSPFSVGPKFEQSIESCELFTREQVVKAVAYLLGGVPGSLAAHPLRTGSGGNDKQRVRRSDGARAYRCSIKQKSNGAPRLHYWLTSEGCVELSVVAPHESFDIV